jgi:DNA repair exonuclease SbcCD nuclease subunit/energy-coupling factor transporter ATP-binding protein EcfA2
LITIAHASDIQIRAFRRHQEYREHFRNFCSSLSLQKPDAIVLAGDIGHDKLTVSPEFYDVLVDFLDDISSIAPVIITPGNHDGLIHNQSRLDILTPAIKAMDKDNIFYLKKSDNYDLGFDGVDFYLFSCFDDESKWPAKVVDRNRINIGIFHGMVQGAVLQNGQIVEECPYKLKHFLDIVDYLMLGDIHKEQILDSSYRAAYPGSLIQQNYAESLDKGYLIWRIKDKQTHTVDFVKLPNVCPFYSIYLEQNLQVPTDHKFQKNSRIRVVTRDLTSAEKKKITEDVEQFYEPIEVDFLELDKQEKKISLGSENTKIDNLDDISVQESLLKSFLAPYNLDDQILKQVLELNKHYDVKSDENALRNVKYEIGPMSFSNLFSYGEDNYFDFSKHKGIVGIFGKNGSGKSSLAVDILNYTLFNRISKKGVVKNDLLINESKEFCGSSLQIKIKNDKHIITRGTHVFTKSGKKQGEPVLQGKTDVNYKVIHQDGSEENRDGEERDDTDAAIRRVFGSPEDFLLTSIAPQWQLLGFVDSGATERLRLIGRYFDIDIFEKKHKLAKEDCKEIKTKIKYLEDKKLQEQIEKHKARLEILQTQFQNLQNTISVVEDDSNKAKSLNDKIRELKYKKSLLVVKLSELNKKLVQFNAYECISNSNCCLLKELATTQCSVSATEDVAANIEAEIKLNQTKLDELNLDDNRKILKDELNDVTAQIVSSKTLINQAEKDLTELKKLKHEYQIYDYFLLANSKDGISKQIISKNLDVINKEIKKILSGTVNFDIELVSEDDGKAIEVLFTYQKRGKPRRVEICSGSEKTIAAIVVRAALVSVSNLPRSNIFVLDEPSYLDVDNLGAFSRILNYLKTMFDSVFIITHLDFLKDCVDTAIYVNRDENGFSKIVE